MTTATVWDHALVALLLVVVPLWSHRAYRSFVRRLATGDRGARRKEYLWTIALEWGLCAVVLLLWALEARPLSALGLTLPLGLASIGGLIATLIGLAFLAAQWRSVAELDERGLDELRAQVDSAAAMIPRSDAEHRLFRVVALTAGIVEELVYRGYLIAYLCVFLGAWPAVLAASVAFGLGHSYQGPAGVVKTGVVGLISGALYVATGSLLWPMILHVAVDLQGGAMGRRVLGDREMADDGSTAAPEV